MELCATSWRISPECKTRKCLTTDHNTIHQVLPTQHTATQQQITQSGQWPNKPWHDDDKKTWEIHDTIPTQAHRRGASYISRSTCLAWYGALQELFWTLGSLILKIFRIFIVWRNSHQGYINHVIFLELFEAMHRFFEWILRERFNKSSSFIFVIVT